jgi:hypothetical protein
MMWGKSNEVVVVRLAATPLKRFRPALIPGLEIDLNRSAGLWPRRRLSRDVPERLRLKDEGESGGSPAQVKTRFLRFLDLDSRVHRQEHSEEASPNADERRF